MPAARPSRRVIENAIAACKAQGLPVGGVEVTRDGTVRILASPVVGAVASDQEGNTCDEVFGVQG